LGEVLILAPNRLATGSGKFALKPTRAGLDPLSCSSLVFIWLLLVQRCK
jgi:hypothetical protein